MISRITNIEILAQKRSTTYYAEAIFSASNAHILSVVAWSNSNPFESGRESLKME